MKSEAESPREIADIIRELVEAWAIIVDHNNALLIKTPEGLSPFGGSVTAVPENEERWTIYIQRAARERLQNSAGEIGLSLSSLYPRFILEPYWSATKRRMLVGCAIPTVYFNQEIIAPEKAGLEIVSIDDLVGRKIDDQLVIGEDMRRLIQRIAHLVRIA